MNRKLATVVENSRKKKRIIISRIEIQIIQFNGFKSKSIVWLIRRWAITSFDQLIVTFDDLRNAFRAF